MPLDAVNLALPIDEIVEGQVVTYRLVLPFLPPSKNVYAGWPAAWQSSAKKKWLRWIKQLTDEQQVPHDLPKVGLAAALIFPSKAHRDPQNYAQAIWHWVPDGLVRAGVLVDDNEGRIQIGRNWGISFGYDTRKIDPRKRQRTIITLSCHRAVMRKDT